MPILNDSRSSATPPAEKMRPIRRRKKPGLEVKTMDTILNTHYDAVFSGTPEEVRAYLLESASVADYLVRLDGGQVVRADEYLAASPA
jgi:hypothetical protein